MRQSLLLPWDDLTAGLGGGVAAGVPGYRRRCYFVWRSVHSHALRL